MLDLARLPFASVGQATTGLEEATRLTRSRKGRRDTLTHLRAVSSMRKSRARNASCAHTIWQYGPDRRRQDPSWAQCRAPGHRPPACPVISTWGDLGALARPPSSPPLPQAQGASITILGHKRTCDTL